MQESLSSLRACADRAAELAKRAGAALGATRTEVETGDAEEAMLAALCAGDLAGDAANEARMVLSHDPEGRSAEALDAAEAAARAAEFAAEAVELIAMSVRYAHGIRPSDLDTVRAVILIYGGAALNALRAYYTNFDAPGRVDRAALHAWVRYDSARDALSQWWARGKLDAPLVIVPPADEARAAWLRVVEEDVRARLAGDMGRPLPVPDAYAAGEG